MKQVQILGKTYKIIRETEIGVAGETNPVKSTIKINGEMTVEAQEEALIHEIFEVINMDCDLGLKHNQISTLSCVFYSVAKNQTIINQTKTK